MHKLNVAYIGWFSYDKTDFSTPYAVCDINEEKVKSFVAAHPEVKGVTDYRQLAADPAVDVVIISSPNWLHCEMVEAFMGAGKHVFCEKPMGINRDEMNRMLLAQRASGKQLAIDFEMRVSLGPIRLKEILDGGELGTIRGIEFIHHRGGWLAQGNGIWRTDPARSGGLYFMEPCHEVDIFRFLLGEITHVQSFRMQNTMSQYPETMPDNMYSFFFFESGAIGTIATSHKLSVHTAAMDQYDELGHDMNFVIYGDKGALRFNCITNRLLIVKNIQFPPGSNGVRIELDRIEQLDSKSHHNIEANRLAFLQACAEGRPHVQDAEDAWRTHCVCLAAEESALSHFEKLNVDYSL